MADTELRGRPSALARRMTTTRRYQLQGGPPAPATSNDAAPAGRRQALRKVDKLEFCRTSVRRSVGIMLIINFAILLK